MPVRKPASSQSNPSSKKNSPAPKKGLLALISEIKETSGSTSFTSDDIIEYNVAGNGNIQFKAELEDGTIITFWSNSMDKVLESEDDYTYRLLAGVSISPDGGLIPPNSGREVKWTKRG